MAQSFYLPHGQYGRLAFKLSPSTDDSQWMTAEIRAFRKLIDHTTGFIQEFKSCITLIDKYVEDGPEGIKQMPFSIMVVERVALFSAVDWTGIDPEEMTSRMILAISAAAKNGFQVRDLGPNNWGFGLRSGRIVPLIPDANSWVQLEPTHSAYGKFPSKKMIGSFWPLISSIDATAAQDAQDIVYTPIEGQLLDADRIFTDMLRRLSGLQPPQTWNPFQ